MSDDVLYMKFCLESFERYLRKIGIYRDWDKIQKNHPYDDAVGKKKNSGLKCDPQCQISQRHKFKTVVVGAGIYLRAVNDFPEQNQKDSLS